MDEKNKLEIPTQLQDPQFRFLKIHSGQKRPVGLRWYENAKPFNHPFIKEVLASDEKYGVATGYGGLLGIDFDCPEIQAAVLHQLPKTFCVKSAGKGLIHAYFLCNDVTSWKIERKNKEGKKYTLLDIQGKGRQLIGPSSFSPKVNRRYEVVKDLPIAKLHIYDLRKILMPWIVETKLLKEEKSRGGTADNDNIKSKIDLRDLMSDEGYDLSKNPTCCKLHQDNTPSFSYHQKNGTWVWNCFGCDSAGDIFSFVQMHKNYNFPTAKEYLAKRAGVSFFSFKGKKVTKPLSEEEKEFKKKLKQYHQNALEFWEKQPFFLADDNSFWLWDNTLKQWGRLQVDADLANAYDEALGFVGHTLAPGIKSTILESLRRLGRKRKPKDAPSTWVQFKDRIYDIATDKLFTATPDFFVCNPIPWALGDSEETPEIDKLFKSWVGPVEVQQLKEILAYCMLPDYPIHHAFCLLGSGHNGKGTYQKILKKLIGKNNITAAELEGFGRSLYESSKLYKKLVCLIGETNYTAFNNTSMFKKLTGEDEIDYQFKYKSPFTAQNYAKLVMNSNSLPPSEDTTDGFYRRWVIIKFPNTFSGTEDVFSKIPNIEFNNFARKAVKLLKKLHTKREFTGVGSIENRKNKYLQHSNPMYLFLSSACYRTDDSLCYEKYATLYAAYLEYLKIQKMRKISRKAFSSALDDEGLPPFRSSKDWAGQMTQSTWVEGVKLKNNWQAGFVNTNN